jgi:hypothetical protein
VHYTPTMGHYEDNEFLSEDQISDIHKFNNLKINAVCVN